MSSISIGFKRYNQVMGQWAAAVLPTALVVGGGLTVFRQAVITSIASTPHPELVYAILAAFFVGVLLTCMTLWRYTQEGSLIGRWLQTPAGERDALIARWPQTYLMPLYEILLGKRAVAGGVRQSVLEQEMGNVKGHLEDGLALPHYLAGALVGLGLVGTFVGLLGTLDDLGKLFGALASTDGSADANPADLFADMVRRLQDPMRGMGTAFVASLYGLLGSLVLGLQILVVGRVGHDLSSGMHALLRDEQGNEAQPAVPQPVVLREVDAVAGVDSQAIVQALQATQAGQMAQWQQMFDRLLEQQAHRDMAARTAQSEQSMALQQLLQQMREHHDHHVQVNTAAQNEQTHLWEQASLQIRQQAERSDQENRQLRREIQSVVEAVNALALAVRHNMEAEDRLRKSVPRTGYWQDAWVKVQAYLQRARADHALSDMAATNREQGRVLARLSDSIEQLNQRIGSPSDR